MAQTTRSRGRRASRPPVREARPANPIPELNGPKNAIVERKAVRLPVSHEQIARKAYELWQEHGGPAEQNWLDAETQLRKQAEVGG